MDKLNKKRRDDRAAKKNAAQAAAPQETVVAQVCSKISSRNVVVSVDDWVLGALRAPCECGALHTTEDIAVKEVGLVVELSYACKRCRQKWYSSSQSERTETDGYALNAAFAGISLHTGTTLPKVQDAFDLVGLNHLLSPSVCFDLEKRALSTLKGTYCFIFLCLKSDERVSQIVHERRFAQPAISRLRRSLRRAGQPFPWFLTLRGPTPVWPTNRAGSSSTEVRTGRNM